MSAPITGAERAAIVEIRRAIWAEEGDGDADEVVAAELRAAADAARADERAACARWLAGDNLPKTGERMVRELEEAERETAADAARGAER